jgi:hypothetical protein
LTDRLVKDPDPGRFTQILFKAVLTREPSPDEVQAVTQFLAARTDQRESAVAQAIWALITSTEFCVNH